MLTVSSALKKVVKHSETKINQNAGPWGLSVAISEDALVIACLDGDGTFVKFDRDLEEKRAREIDRCGSPSDSGGGVRGGTSSVVITRCVCGLGRWVGE